MRSKAVCVYNIRLRVYCALMSSAQYEVFHRVRSVSYANAFIVCLSVGRHALYVKKWQDIKEQSFQIQLLMAQAYNVLKTLSGAYSSHSNDE